MNVLKDDQQDWQPIGKCAIQRKPYTIAKYFLPNPKYGLWKDGEEKCLGYFNSADEAKEKADGFQEGRSPENI